MREISQNELKEILKKHKLWLNNEEGGTRADLRGADLRGADLWGADLDYSCWPLWCGSLDVKVDVRLAAQLAYHFCRLVCDDPAYIQARTALVPLANTFHRADECGRLEILEAGK